MVSFKKTIKLVNGKFWSFSHLAKEPAQLLLFTIHSLNSYYLVVWTQTIMEEIHILVVSKKNVIITYWI
jgi:hypothetical protein